jgi:glutaminyl-tRNA synthetase
LFLTEYPGEKTGNYMDDLNPDSLKVIQSKGDPEVKNAKVGDYLQFVRNGYFCVDCKDSTPEHMVFNRTVTLKDSWAKLKDKMQNQNA